MIRRLANSKARDLEKAEPNEIGAMLLEFALMLPLLLALMLEIITGGTALAQKISLNDAAREAARFGATRPVENNLTVWLSDIGDVAIGSATGDLDLGIGGREVCVAYVSPGSDPSDQTTRYVLDETDTWTIAVGQTCFSDGRPSTERRVQVLVERHSILQAGLAERTVSLTGESSVRFERFDS